MSRSRLSITIVLGTTQTLAWASSYYLPAILADAMARDLGVSSAWIFAAFSVALLASAVLGPRIGRTIDAVGGRGVLALSSLVFAAGLILLGLAQSQFVMWLAWLVLGVGMALGLYDTAFATLGRIYGASARSTITGITLIAGFASTIGWPLTAWGLAEYGWRPTCFAWAAAHLLIGLPLNWFLLPRTETAQAAPTAGPTGSVAWDRNMVLLSIAFALTYLVAGAMAAHLPRLLQAAGASATEAIAAGALIGPAQVAARLVEAGLLNRFHPLLSARLAAITHPIGAAVLGLFGGGAAAGAFAILHGSGNGVLTIARGTVPLAIFGPDNYGYRLGLIGAPARIAQAAAPLLFGLLIERWGSGALVVSSAFGIVALIALCFVRAEKTAEYVPADRGSG
ncbi:MFS transporter [Phreatobacter stygius]|uniref:MFS transporter n=1 Tax=Phreatobacter stygius TaxID=1940610 RepID=A0A4D7ASQ9_9HYPH|nr:MFS transporter [Phreatobacter stygius]QCI63989.1 MFS transporter [Phreatobacter stygius]